MQEIDHGANPFPGLRPFESTQTHLFFGRDGQSEELLRRLKRTRFLAVVGTSGSGKSSLVRAGLLPALQGGLMASAGSDWRIAILRPGSDPMGNLARALTSPAVLGSRDEKVADMQAVLAETTLRRSSLGLVELVNRARTKVDEHGQQLFRDYENLLVVVDQFEELFRFKQLIEEENSKEDAAAFVKLLLEAGGQQTEKIYVVLTMRSDFLGDCSQFWDLPEAINNGQYLIPRMTRDERREAISGPVAVGAGTISEPLVNQLLNDVGDNPDQLPILQHALMRTWDHWQSHRNGAPIDIPDYNAIGGMAEALSRHADEAYAELTDAQKAIAERVFKGLTEKGVDNREIRRPMEVQEICELTGADLAAVIAVIEVFRREGRSFLMPPPTDALTGKPVHLNLESLIDISHESLIRNWDRLKTWVDEESQSARIYKRLAQTAMLQQAGEEALLIDPALQGALDWREKNKPNAAWARRYHPDFATAMTFLDASTAARDAERLEREKQRRKDVSFKRTRLAASLLALSFLLALATSVYAYRKSASAQRALTQAQRDKVQADDALALANMKFAEATRARDEATQALAVARKSKDEATSKLQDAEQANAEAVRQLKSARESEARADVARRYAIEQGERARAEAEKNRELFYSADINLAQQAYETGNLDRASDLLSQHKPEQQNTPGFEWYYLNHLLRSEKETMARPDDGLTTVITSPDGQTLIVGAGHKVELRDLKTGGQKPTIIEITDQTFSIGSLAISRDGKFLAVGNSTGADPGETTTTVKLYDLSTGRESARDIGTFKEELSDSANSMIFTADGQRLIIGGNKGHVRVWDMKSRLNTDLITVKGTINLALSPDGNKLAFTSADSEAKTYQVVLWDLSSNKELGRLKHDDIVTVVAFTPDGKSLVSGGFDRSVRWWNLESLESHSLSGYPNKVFSLALSPPDGKIIALGYEDGIIKLCRSSNLIRCATLKGHRQAITSLAFSANGDLLFSSDAKMIESEEGSITFDESAKDTVIKSWDVPGLIRDQTPVLVGQNSRIRPLAYSANSKALAAASGNSRFGSVVMLNAETNAARPVPDVVLDNQTPFALSPDGKMFAAGKTSLHLYSSSTGGKPVGKEIKPAGGTLMAIAFSPDGQVLTTVTKTGAIDLWDTALQEPKASLREAGGSIMEKVAFAPDGRFLALVYERKIEFWDRTQTIPRRRFELPSDSSVVSITFSADGGILAVCYQSGEVLLHDTETFSVSARFVTEVSPSLAFSPDGRILATGASDGTLRLWSKASQRELLTIKAHNGRITSIIFSPDGKQLATADAATMRVWRAPTNADDAVDPKPVGTASLLSAPSDQLPPSLAAFLFPQLTSGSEAIVDAHQKQRR